VLPMLRSVAMAAVPPDRGQSSAVMPAWRASRVLLPESRERLRLAAAISASGG